MENNRLNLYNCKSCGNTIITVDRVDGVTPALLGCKRYGGCETGMMGSSMYNVPPIYTARYEWYKPSEEELRKLCTDQEVYQSMKEYVANGGLDIREIKRQ